MNRLADELDQALAHMPGRWEEVRGRRIFLAGGTGFLGCWLLESFLWANDKLQLGAQAVVLTRDPAAFKKKAHHLATHPAVRLHRGDLADFRFPEGPISHFIHAAGELRTPNPADPAGLIQRTFLGLRRLLEVARRHTPAKVLFISSGAVYGPAVPGRMQTSEDAAPSRLPLTPHSAYAAAKRMAEMFGTLFAAQHGLEFKIARGFAFLGPYLPLDSHLAAGNFIRDALSGGEIRVSGSGTAVRSYMYAADLAVWLWTILFLGAPGRPYNVGSDQPLSIAALAQAVARECHPTPAVRVLGQTSPGEILDYYVPDVARARTELGLQVSVPLPEGIRRTLRWHRRPAG